MIYDWPVEPIFFCSLLDRISKEETSVCTRQLSLVQISEMQNTFEY